MAKFEKIENWEISIENDKLIFRDMCSGNNYEKKVTKGYVKDIHFYKPSNLIIIQIFPRKVSLDNDYLDKSLIAVDLKGKQRWSAELPQKGILDLFILSRVEGNEIYAVTEGGFLCQINPKNGKIISRKLVK